MADTAQCIGKRVENEHGMVGVIFDVSDHNVFISYVRYRPDDEPGMYWLTMPIEGLEWVSPALPD